MKVIISVLVMVALFFVLGLLKADQQLGVAEAKVTYRLVDESGVPFSNQVVHAWFSFLDSRKNVSQIMRTDYNGCVELKDRAQESCGIWVEKDGYYRGRSEMNLVRTSDYHIVEGKWYPYGESKELVLKKIDSLGKLAVLPKNRNLPEWNIPCEGEWVGFDMMKYDWVAPYGKGVDSDFLARFEVSVRHWNRDFSIKMDISFTNNLYAGVVIKNKDKSSDLNWNLQADADEKYVPWLAYYSERRPGCAPQRIGLRDDQVAVFRTRTKVDEEGRLVSAHYGVISGAWIAGSQTMRFEDAVFNPVENSTALDDSSYLRNGDKYKRDMERLSQIRVR